MNLSIEQSIVDPNFLDLRLTPQGQLELVSDTEEIAQFLAQRLRTFFGEWFLDNTIGVPYFEEIFTKQQNVDAIEAIFIDEILSTPGVVQLFSFELDIPDLSKRQLEISFDAQITGSLEPLIVDSLLIP